MSSPTNVTPRRVSTVTTSPSRIAASFVSASPGSAATVDAERTELARDDVGVGVQVDGRLVGAGGDAEPAADVDLDDRVPGRPRPLHGLDRRRQRALERRQGRPASQPDPAWKWIVSTARSWRAAAASASSKPFELDAELRRPVAAVLEMRRCSRRRCRVDADPDAPSRRTPAVPLDLADRVEVEMDAVREQDVEVAVRDVRPGVADLVRPPAALEGAQRPHRASRRRCRRSRPCPGAPRPRKTARTSGQRVRLERESQPEREPGRSRRRACSARAFSPKRARS